MQDVVVVSKFSLIAAMFFFGAVVVIMGYFLIRPWLRHNLYPARMRRRAHRRYVERTVLELRYKIINLALACERGDLSLTAFNRRVLNTAVLIRRYEVKLGHLRRLVG